MKLTDSLKAKTIVKPTMTAMEFDFSSLDKTLSESQERVGQMLQQVEKLDAEIEALSNDIKETFGNT